MKKFKVKCEDKNYIVNAKSEAEAVKKLRDAKAKKLGDAYYTENEKKDKTFVRNAIEEMSRYIRNWNYLSAKEKRDIGSNLPELKARVEELRKVADGKCIEDAEPIIVEAIPYKNEMYVVLEFSWNGSKRWIVVAKENYHNEKKYTGGGSVEYSLNGAKKTADDFYTMNKLDKKYGRTEGYKRWMRGETDSEIDDEKYINTPRGRITLSEKKEEELKKEGYGYWFTASVEGKEYRILNNGTLALAVTDEKLEISDANKRTYLDRNEIAKIESEARSLRGNWISIYVGVDADKEGYFINEMYINTTGTWLYKLSDIKEYMRELDSANKFMNKYEKFAENRRA